MRWTRTTHFNKIRDTERCQYFILFTVYSSKHYINNVALRHVAIALPFKYRAMDRPKRMIIVNTGVWLFSLSLCAILYFVPSISNSFAPNMVYPVNIFILCAIILVFYTSTHRTFRRQRKQLFTLNSTNQQLCQQKLKT